jgi:3-dehydroquinate synthase
MSAQRLTIKSKNLTYTAFAVETFNDLIEELTSTPNAMMIIDHHISLLYPDLISKLNIPFLAIEATEENKTLEEVEGILSFLQDHSATRSTRVIAIGGGITQDMTAFAAHIYYRGLSVIYVPTTLVAMSDSCLGGKCGVNFRRFKNQIGAIHPPEKIIIWPGFTQSLGDNDIYSGYSEILKHALINDSFLYRTFCSELQNHGFRSHLITDHIFSALAVKKQYIEEDEFDNGVRRILNYGHTFGHGIETITHYQIPHGLAILYGMDIANYISYQKGLLSEKDFISIHQFIKQHFPFLLDLNLSPKLLLESVMRDKKISENKLNMILLKGIGQPSVVPIPFDEALTTWLKDYFHFCTTHTNN